MVLVLFVFWVAWFPLFFGPIFDDDSDYVIQSSPTPQQEVAPISTLVELEEHEVNR
jgi:hypothetical protein